MNSGGYSNSLKVSPFSTAEFAFTPLKDIETDSSRIVKVIVVTEDNIAITDSLKLFYGTNYSSYSSVKMISTGNTNEFSATIPGYPLGTNINYYFSIYDVLGEYTYLPGGAPSVPYTYFVGIDMNTTNYYSCSNCSKDKIRFSI